MPIALLVIGMQVRFDLQVDLFACLCLPFLLLTKIFFSSEANDSLGCPIYGDLRPWRFKDGVVEPSFGDGTANQNCCHCFGTGAPTPKPTSSCSGDTINWRDNENYTCSWYELNDAAGCPRFGNSYEGSMGVANDNCCWCKGEGKDTEAPTSAFPAIALYPTPSPSAVAD